MEENTQKNSAVWYTVGAIIIVIAAYMLFFKSPTETIAPTDDTMATSTSSTASSTLAASLTIADQFSTSTVTVDKVVTSAPAWVVIHEDRGGKPGNILGAAWVPAGNTEGLTVELLRGATEGQTYYAMIHAEDGITGFDFKTDLPITDASGNPVMKTYKVIFGKS